MQDRKLLEVNIRIAKLRDKIASGHGDLSDGPEIDRLVKQRMEVIKAMAVALRHHRTAAQNISARS
jgi:hypothetical protein